MKDNERHHLPPQPISHQQLAHQPDAQLLSVQPSAAQLATLAEHLHTWAEEFGFAQISIGSIELAEHAEHLQHWLEQGFHGEMAYMDEHRSLRLHPEQLMPGTIRVISARMDYLPPAAEALETLKDNTKAYISRYALGRDYHKLIRKRLTRLAERMVEHIGPFRYRALTDSAPVLEKALAARSGLGWIGKHTLLIHRSAGSWFFLGELYVDLPLPVDAPVSAHCGSCSACLEICPTQAIVSPWRLDARRCISYLTIELKGAIPLELRPLIGNRVFGCDDCQLVCPWNRYARFTKETDFHPRHHLDSQDLLSLFQWDEATFLQRTEGSAIRRAGYSRFRRNLAVGLGNSTASPQIQKVLQQHATDPDLLVREHVLWAIARQEKPSQFFPESKQRR
jgi:epoxyqueuosine reductase